MLPAMTLEQAQERLLALATPQPIERVLAEEARGRYLAEPLTALRTQPAADASAMDGYAVRLADLPGPWTIIGESAAGHPFVGTVTGGTAVRISTGALMPRGADKVILDEDCERTEQNLRLAASAEITDADHIRRCGNDFAQGAALLDTGARIGAAQIALAVTAGHLHLPVRRAPRIAILESGDELAADPQQCAAHQVPASNGAMLAALIADCAPCRTERMVPVGDSLEQLRSALDRCKAADIIVTSGGVSIGDHDLIRPALEQWGAEIDFWKVAIKPGKPLLVARRGHQVVLGLPGNPVSSMVTGYLFLLPLIRAMLGAANPLPAPVFAKLLEPIGPGGQRRVFLRASLSGAGVSTASNQGSAALLGLATSNALIDRGALAPATAAGTPVPVYLLENGGNA